VLAFYISGIGLLDADWLQRVNCGALIGWSFQRVTSLRHAVAAKVLLLGTFFAACYTIRHFKFQRYITVFNDTCPHAFTEGADDGDKVCGAAELEQNFPDSSAVHRIECLREINKDRVQLALLLPTLLLQLSGCKYHIHGSAACAEISLTLG